MFFNGAGYISSAHSMLHVVYKIGSVHATALRKMNWTKNRFKLINGKGMVQIKFSRAEFCEWAKGSRSVKVYKYKSVISEIYSFQ